MISQMFGDTQLDKGTSVVAAAAVVSPGWLHYLQNVSDLFSVLLPILGGIWLIVQIVGYFWRKK